MRDTDVLDQNGSTLGYSHSFEKEEIASSLHVSSIGYSVKVQVIPNRFKF
jgi:hypothetical protein